MQNPWRRCGNLRTPFLACSVARAQQHNHRVDLRCEEFTGRLCLTALESSGMRGTVRLAAGTWRVSSTIKIRASGVMLQVPPRSFQRVALLVKTKRIASLSPRRHCFQSFQPLTLYCMAPRVQVPARRPSSPRSRSASSQRVPAALSRRRDCHSADIPSPSILKRLLKGGGGCSI